MRMNKLAPLILPALLPAAVTVQKVTYAGWPNCYRVSNGEVDLVVTADVGPRVIRFGYVGGPNAFKEFREQLGGRNEATFQLRGGDRVWKAPEDPVASWAPDNVPVEIRIVPDGLIARAPVEPLTKLQKEIGISMAPTGTEVVVTHRIANRSLFTLEFAPWALTMMAQGGMAITGFPPRGKHPANLEATNPLVMWAYTDLSDPRWKFTRKYLMLRQDPQNAEAQKVGLFNPDVWAVYLNGGQAFVKQAHADPRGTYPDFGCAFETFTNNEFLEIETLGPLTKVAPDTSVEQVERWRLYSDIHLANFTDDELDRVLLPLVRPAAAGNR